MPDSRIVRVEEMARRDKASIGVTFMSRIKNPFNWGEDEGEIMIEEKTNEQEMPPYPNVQAEMTEVDYD